jgi:dienelactone hydrolase
MNLRRAALGFALAITASAAQAQGFGDTSFRSADGTTIRAVYMKPPGAGPFPAVVALHGCGGLYSTRGPGLSRRHQDWAARWVAQGYAVLMPDSFGSRGLGSICGTRERAVRPGRERVADVQGARAFLQSQPDIRANRIVLVGWSNGGSTVLHAVSRGAAARDGRPDFARAVAFYPGCRTPLERGTNSRVPVSILIGGADNWTPAGPCRALVDRMRASGNRADITVYPDAYHGFDDPASRVRERSGLAYTGDGSGRAMVGTNPAARQDAIRRLADPLGR